MRYMSAPQRSHAMLSSLLTGVTVRGLTGLTALTELTGLTVVPVLGGVMGFSGGVRGGSDIQEL